MSYQKNDVLTVKIEDMGHDGEGIGKCEGYTLFVKDTVIGDLAEVKVIKAKKNYGYARLVRLIEPSAHRVESVCPVARPCGGCQLQMLDYAEQLRFKEKKIAGNLQRIGGMTEIPMEPIVGMENPFRYRNKAQFPIGQDRNGKLITGFYAGRTHQIMENRNCYLGVEQNEEILNRILAWMEENGVPAYNEETGKGLVRHVLIRFGFTTKEIMVCLVVNGKKLPAEKKLIQSLTELEGMTSITLSVNRERTNVIMGKEIRCLWGQEFITDYIGKVKYQISPLSSICCKVSKNAACSSRLICACISSTRMPIGSSFWWRSTRRMRLFTSILVKPACARNGLFRCSFLAISFPPLTAC